MTTPAPGAPAPVGTRFFGFIRGIWRFVAQVFRFVWWLLRTFWKIALVILLIGLILWGVRSCMSGGTSDGSTSDAPASTQDGASATATPTKTPPSPSPTASPSASDSTPAEPTDTPSTTVTLTDTASPQPSETKTVENPYELIQYQDMKNVPEGNYGPPCWPNKKSTSEPTSTDTEVCLTEMLKRIGHNPLLASSVAVDLGLPDELKSGMSAKQIEKLRRKLEAELTKSIEARQILHDQIATVFKTIDFKMERLHGWYWTARVTKGGGIVYKKYNSDAGGSKFGLVGVKSGKKSIVYKTDIGFAPSYKAKAPPAPVPAQTAAPAPRHTSNPAPAQPRATHSARPVVPSRPRHSATPRRTSTPKPTPTRKSTGKSKPPKTARNDGSNAAGSPQSGAGNAPPGDDGCSGDCGSGSGAETSGGDTGLGNG